MQFRIIIILFIVFACAKNCMAQQKPALPYDFLPGEKTIFEDNFLLDTIGDFPAKWQIAKCIGSKKNDSAGMRMVMVEEDSLENVLAVSQYGAPHIEQKINATHTVSDVFTLEFDFILNNPGSNVAVEFQLAEKMMECRSVFFSVMPGAIYYSTFYPKINQQNLHYPSYFDSYAYHHMAISYVKGGINFYVDQYHLLSLPATGYNPIKYGLCFKGPAKIKNFRLASGRAVNPFFRLTSEKKMVFYNLEFSPGKTNLMAGSMGCIMQLAQFLKGNPSTKLEIDVHTDNSSTAMINQRMSKVRADEIKRQLVLAGIDAQRLTTKGFGDTMPIKPNTTSEGRMANRRVEFIKQ
jgi:OOP family OmpA-OmpF porin